MTKHRGHGEGSIFQRKDGRWCVAVTVGRDALGKPRRHYVYADTRREAQEKLNKILNEQQSGLFTEPSKATLAAFLEQWLEDSVRPSSARNTYDNYAIIIKKHISPALGGIYLAKLTPQHLQRFYREKRDEGLTRTVRLCHAVLHRALNQAMKWSLVPRNVADAVDVPKVERKEGHALGQEEATRFLAAAEEDRLYAFYAVLMALGLRMGEALGLSWDDVDLDAGVLRVRRNLQWFNEGPQLVELKTAKSRRTLALPPVAADALRRHREAQAVERSVAVDAWDTEGAWPGLVFTTGVGTPISPSAIRNRSMPKILKAAGLPKITPHGLRHTATSLLLQSGENPRVVADMLGHSTTRMTMDVYAHVVGGAQRAAADRMEGILGGRGKKKPPEGG